MESQDFQHIATTVRPKLMNLCQSFFDRQELAYGAEDADSEVAKSYGDKGKNGVIKIFTEKMPEAVTYFINGKKASKADFNKLSPDSIKVIKVLKRGSAAAIQASPDGNTNDIYMITTK